MLYLGAGVVLGLAGVGGYRVVPHTVRRCGRVGGYFRVAGPVRDEGLWGWVAFRGRHPAINIIMGLGSNMAMQHTAKDTNRLLIWVDVSYLEGKLKKNKYELSVVKLYEKL